MMNTTKKTQALQNIYLNTIRKEHIIVEVFLVNGVRLLGLVDSFDPYVILLKNAKSNVTQMVYKHAISTIQPSRPINFPISTERQLDDEAEDQANI